jgi:transposase-like protein
MNRKQDERRELWRQRIRQQEKAGQAIRAFCRERGLNENLFYAWRQRLISEKKPLSFALIETKAAAETAVPQPIELLLKSGERLRIAADGATLRLVLSVLGEQQA